MSIDLEIILGHNLDSDRIANLPTLLDRYFAPHLENIQLRLEHGYVWSPVKTLTGGWKWEESCFDDFAERRNLLGIEEDVWQWCYEEKYGESFEEWFQNHKSEGYIPINGFAGLMLFVGKRAVLLGTDIKWHHFLLDSLLQEDLRNFIPYLVDFFGSNCRSIIYAAGGCEPAGAILDDYIMKGWSIEQIIPHLNEMQPPVKSIKDMIITGNNDEIESFKYDGYYVENL
jgi:hypothetical protein